MAVVRWERDLKERAFQLGLSMLKLYPRLARLGPHFAHIGLQLFQAASSVGAQLQEGDVAASRRDMALKQAVGLREAKEARYWLRMLIAAEVFAAELEPHYRGSGEIVAMLTVSVRKLRTPRPGETNGSG